jgi:hypothetical protein
MDVLGRLARSGPWLRRRDSEPRTDEKFQPRSQKVARPAHPLRAENRTAMRFPGDGARGTRTPDLLGAIQALSQLSYSPVGRRQQAGFRASAVKERL